MIDELTARRRFRDWFERETTAHPFLTPREIEARAYKHAEEDRDFREALDAIAERAVEREVQAAVEGVLREKGYRPEPGRPGTWEKAPGSPPEN